MSAPLPAVLVCDAPWSPRDQLPGPGRGAASNYDVIATADLCKLKRPAMAERHVLLFWRIAAMIEDAAQVLDAWGYVAASEIVWCKLRICPLCIGVKRVQAHRVGGEVVLVPALEVPSPSDRVCPRCHGRGGTPHTGLGHYVRAAHEVCIIARPKRGRAPERLDKGVSSVFAAPMLVDVDGVLPGGRKGGLVHSAKPDAFYALAEQLYPGPRAEMFGRRARPGWTVQGHEAGKLDTIAETFRAWPARVRAERLGLEVAR